MATQIDNEFLTSLTDSRVRPYNVGIKRHTESLATIVVYSDRGSPLQPSSKNFLDVNELDSGIKTLISSSQTVSERDEIRRDNAVNGYPSASSGSISNLKLDGESDFYGVFNNFSLLSVNESHEQITKIHVNFGSTWNAFLFGEKPRIYTFTGFFLDSENYPYYQEFMTAYDKYISGRKAVENKLQTTFVYDGRIIDGYILNISTNHTASDQLIKNFSFTVLVKGFKWVRMNMVPSVNAINPGTKTVPMERRLNALTNIHRQARERVTSPGDVYALNTNTAPPAARNS